VKAGAFLFVEGKTRRSTSSDDPRMHAIIDNGQLPVTRAPFTQARSTL